MGCGGSTLVDPEETKRDKEIGRGLQQSQQQDKKCLAKLLLLGPGESGKSTIFKQLIIAGRGFTDLERSQKSGVIQESTISYMYDLSQAVEENEALINLQLSDKAKAFVSVLRELNNKYVQAKAFEPEFQKKFTQFWQEEAVQATWALKTGNVQVPRCLEHFMKKQSQVYQKSYSATDEDMLLVRARTTGIVEEQFEINDEKIVLVDVGGQRSERRKWLNCFDQVTAVLFVAAVGDFDMAVWEDQSTNRIHEALTLLTELVKNKIFANTPFILFLNKSDIFEEKLTNGIQLSICFPDYTGDNSVESAKEFLSEKFMNCRQEGPKLFVHFTCATDSQQIRKLFGSVVEVIINRVLIDTGLM